MTNNKKPGLELGSGIVTVALSLVALLLFFLGFSTNYYIFGQMQSGLVLLLILSGIVLAAAAIFLRKQFPDALWTKLLTYGVTALLASAAILLLGDRVEGIGNCIITDYDSGHGGEEAIYMSLGAVIALLIAVVFNIIGSFDSGKAAGKAKTIAFYAVACLLCLAVLIPSLQLGGILRSAAPAPAAGGSAGSGEAVKYSVTFNANNENLDRVPDYQFLCSNFAGFLTYDSRFYVDVTLTLDGKGGYELFSEAYCVEGGKRAEVGDDTGLGMNLNTTATGTYVDNGDGTVSISTPAHAVFQMEMDTYSSQMKEAAGMGVGEHSEDGVYDSNDYPEVLAFVPDTVFTLSGKEIVSWKAAGPSGSYTVSFNTNNENLDRVPDYQFLCSNFSGFLTYDSRFYVDVILTLDGKGGYELFSEAYCVENGKRAEVGDDTGLGMNLNTVASGSYVENEDGTITTFPATQATFTMEMDTYSSQMKEAAGMSVGEHSEDGVYDSAEYPEVLDFVPETVWTLESAGKAVVTWAAPAAGEEPEAEAETEEPAAETGAEIATVPSNDEGTSLTFFDNGSYRFWFEAYSIEDLGTWTFADGVLTLTDVNGLTYSGEGDPIALHYGYSGAPDQLTGEYTIDPAIFAAAPAEAEEPAAEAGAEIATVPSNDEGTSLTFFDNGTYRFRFEAYSIEDLGTWTFADGMLTLTDVNGLSYSGEGDPIALHYGYSGAPDQLTGEYTIDPSIFAAAPAEKAAEEMAEEPAEAVSVTVVSDDHGTSMTFNSDSTYRFWFAAYSIEDLGAWGFADGVLTLTDVNELSYTAEGEPLKLHYGYSGAPDQLTGEYTVPTSSFAMEKAGTVVPSDDLGTTMCFFADGTYRFEFGSYSIVDEGTYTFADGLLTLTDVNGLTYTGEGETIALHYGYSGAPDQLTGEYTIDPAIFG